MAVDRRAAASVMSLNEATLSAEINARIVAVHAEVGQSVQQGQLLMELDADQFRIERDRARAQLALTEAGLDLARLRAERARRLAPERFVSEDQLLEAETILRQARAEHALAQETLAAAELILQRTALRAPFDGVVSARWQGLGALASPGTALIELVATDALEVSTQLAPALVPGLSGAGTIEFVAGSAVYPVRVDRVAERISRGSRTQEVRLRFAGPEPLPGSEGVIRWRDPRPALPPGFLLEREGRLGVLLLSDDEQYAEFLALPGADVGRPYSVDLPDDTLLIDRGRQRLAAGDRVRIEP